MFFCGDTDYRALFRRCLAMTPEDVIATVSESGLRGLGGAGFPTATNKVRPRSQRRGEVHHLQRR